MSLTRVQNRYSYSLSVWVSMMHESSMVIYYILNKSTWLCINMDRHSQIENLLPPILHPSNEFEIYGKFYIIPSHWIHCALKLNPVCRYQCLWRLPLLHQVCYSTASFIIWLIWKLDRRSRVEKKTRFLIAWYAKGMWEAVRIRKPLASEDG